MRNKKRVRRPRPAAAQTIHYAQTKPSKAVTAAVITVAGLFGITLTDGTAQLIVMGLQLVAVVYGVWRTYNAPKRTVPGGMSEFMGVTVLALALAGGVVHAQGPHAGESPQGPLWQQSAQQYHHHQHQLAQLRSKLPTVSDDDKGGNIGQAMTWAQFQQVDEGQTARKVQDLCNGCYWFWGRQFTDHGNDYRWKVYLAGQTGAYAFVGMRFGDDQAYHVAYSKRWNCGYYYGEPQGCDYRESFQ